MKKRLFNQFLCIAFSIITMIGTSTTVLANETLETNYTEEIQTNYIQHENNFAMDIVPTIENGITPYKTIYGNGGSCTIDYMASGKYVAWGVKPATSLMYTFTGTVTIYTNSTGAFKGFGPCYGMATGTKSGIVDVTGMKLRSGTVYKAVLAGTATDFLGKNYIVSPGASITFTYRK
jgi:hypothetical protein